MPLSGESYRMAKTLTESAGTATSTSAPGQSLTSPGVRMANAYVDIIEARLRAASIRRGLAADARARTLKEGEDFYSARTRLREAASALAKHDQDAREAFARAYLRLEAMGNPGDRVASTPRFKLTMSESGGREVTLGQLLGRLNEALDADEKRLVSAIRKVIKSEKELEAASA